jgi:hypothetical protein
MPEGTYGGKKGDAVQLEVDPLPPVWRVTNAPSRARGLTTSGF